MRAAVERGAGRRHPARIRVRGEERRLLGVGAERRGDHERVPVALAPPPRDGRTRPRRPGASACPAGRRGARNTRRPWRPPRRAQRPRPGGDASAIATARVAPSSARRSPIATCPVSATRTRVGANPTPGKETRLGNAVLAVLRQSALRRRRARGPGTRASLRCAGFGRALRRQRRNEEPVVVVAHRARRRHCGEVGRALEPGATGRSDSEEREHQSGQNRDERQAERPAAAPARSRPRAPRAAARPGDPRGARAAHQVRCRLGLGGRTPGPGALVTTPTGTAARLSSIATSAASERPATRSARTTAPAIGPSSATSCRQPEGPRGATTSEAPDRPAALEALAPVRRVDHGPAQRPARRGGQLGAQPGLELAGRRRRDEGRPARRPGGLAEDHARAPAGRRAQAIPTAAATAVAARRPGERGHRQDR